MPEPLAAAPTLGDVRAALLRLMDQPARSASARMADWLILRDWVTQSTFVMRQCYRCQVNQTCHPHCERLLSVLLDDRPTGGAREAGRCTGVPLDGPADPGETGG